MSKIYSLYQQLKENNKEITYLFKSGLFYIALGDDAINLSKQFNLKLTKFNDVVLKCGFPVSSVDKYINLFSSYGIKFKLVDFNSNIIYSPKEFQLNNSVQDILNSIASIDTNNLSISEIYNYVDELKLKCQQLQNFSD